MRSLLDQRIGDMQGTNPIHSLDSVMSDHSPFQLGAQSDISDQEKVSLMPGQYKNMAIQAAGNQRRQSDLYRAIQDRLASSASFSSLKTAVEVFNNSVTQDRRGLLIDKQTNFHVLLEVVQEDLKKRFSAEMPQSKKTQIWRNIKSGLEKFCQVVHHYSSVMDVLVSAHPEIAALAWGAMKFLLAVSLNHQELKGKIVLHLAEIGEQFKIMDSYVRLFPEADMVEHVCAVYDNFTRFLQLSIDWCKENALVKFFKNVALPYEARIKPTIDDLNEHMRKVKERVDVHNTHRLAVMQDDVSALIGILNDDRKLQVDSHASIVQLLQSIASDHRKGTSQPLGSITNSSYARIENELAVTSTRPEEGSSTFLQTLPNLQHTFEHLKDSTVQSVQLEAHHSYFALDLPNKPQVRDWLRSNESALLWVDGFAHSRAGKWTTEFSVDVLLGAERQRSTVLFYFGDIATGDLAEPSSDYRASPKAILHSFIVQLLRQHAHLARTEADGLTPEHWPEARCSTKAAWNLLHCLLQSLSAEASMVYLIVDSIDTLTPFNDRPDSLRTFLRHLSALVTSPPSSERAGSNASFAVKILLTSVTGNIHSLLFPPTAARSPPSHFIVHIPQTFGQHNVAPVPGHLRKPGAKRLVRLPDSDDEFGLKPADSFEFSDEEDEGLAFSSSEEDTKGGRSEKGRGKEAGREIGAQKRTAQQPPRKVDRKPGRSVSGSSEELDFSENETDGALKGKRGTDDIDFSSSDDA